MKYRGYSINPEFAPGSDFDFTKDGRIKTRKPKKEDILCYGVEDKEGVSWGYELTIEEAKAWVDKLNAIEHMP